MRAAVGAALLVGLVACDDPSRPPPRRAPPAPIAFAPPDAAPPPPPCRPAARPCEQRHDSPDGAIDYRTRFEYRDDGLVAAERLFDDQKDPPLFKEYRKRYDDQGRLVQVDTIEKGRLAYVERYTYRGGERDPATSRFDSDGDGDIDRTERHANRRKGELHIHETDEDGD